jgi:hypothetical protein
VSIHTNSLRLANNLALIICSVGGTAQYALGRRALSFTRFDQNVLMLLYYSDGAALARRDPDSVHRVMGPIRRISTAPRREPRDLGLADGQFADALGRVAAPNVWRLGTHA